MQEVKFYWDVESLFLVSGRRPTLEQQFMTLTLHVLSDSSSLVEYLLLIKMQVCNDDPKDKSRR